MKRLVTLIGLLYFCVGLAQEKIQENRIEGQYTINTFFTEAMGPYIEIALVVNGNTLTPKMEGAQQFVEANILYSIINDFDSIVAFERIDLRQESVNDTGVYASMLDVQRIPVPSGMWHVEITISDAGDPDRVEKGVERSIQLKSIPTIFSSDIQLVDRFAPASGTFLTKSGVDVIPYMSNFFPDGSNSLKFYTEVYNSNMVVGDSGQFLASYYLRDLDNGKVLSKYTSFKRLKGAKVNVITSEFDITKLPSGNYDLVIDLIDRDKNSLLSFSRFVQRSNPNMEIQVEDLLAQSVFETYKSQEQLRMFMTCLRPIATDAEQRRISTLEKEGQVPEMQTFLVQFWHDQDPVNTEEKWLEYKSTMDIVNESYSTSIRPGCETDPGITYLRYGAPNQYVQRENEPASYPYMIWHYYQHPRRSNAKYVFYTTDLVSNEYTMLHSNVRGEINNPRWHYDLNIRTEERGNIDQTEATDYYGSRALDYYNNPR